MYAGHSDVSVVVANVHQAGPYSAGSYVGLSQAGTTLYAPLLMANNSNWHSDLTVFNTGSSAANVIVQYMPAAGYSGCTMGTAQTIPARGSYRFNLRTNPGCPLGSPFVGGAKVTQSTTTQPLVAVGNQWRDSNLDGVPESFMSYEAAPAGQTFSFQPLLMRDNNTWYTGASFQDTAGSGWDPTVFYYPGDNGTSCGSSLIDMVANGVTTRNPLPPSGQCGVSPAPFVGSGHASRGYGFAAVVNQATTASLKTMSYSAVRQGATTVVLPVVLKNHTWWGLSGWNTGLAVQNLGSSATTVNISYYDESGALIVTESSVGLPVKAMHVYNPAPTSGGIGSFQGTAVVTANQPLAVVVNLTAPSDGGDSAMSYTGVSH